MKKHIFLCLLALACTTGVRAESGTCGPNLSWDYTNGVLTISGSGTMTDYSSGSNTPWGSLRTNILRIDLPDGLTSIGSHAFEECKKN